MPLRRPAEKSAVFVCQSNWHLSRFPSLYPRPPSYSSFHSSQFLTLSPLCPLACAPLLSPRTSFPFPHYLSPCLSLSLNFVCLSFPVGIFRHSSSRASSGSGPPCGNDYPAVAPSSAPASPTCREDRGHRGFQTALLPVSITRILVSGTSCPAQLPREEYHKAQNLLISSALT